MKALLGKNFPESRRYHMKVAPLRMTVLETAQTMLNTVKPRPEGRALIDSVLMKWVFESSTEGK